MPDTSTPPVRKIIHIDMDAFFAAVEQKENPEYRGKPLIVGGSAARRGVVATCSYEARKFGVHSAMPTAQALRLCPDAIVVPTRIPAYRRISREVFEILRAFTPLVEPVSIDEAYLDVSGRCRSATRTAAAIKERIKARTGLTASAGISYNKFLAKIASDINKPDGLFTITPETGEAFIAKLPVGRFHGVGKVTEARMHELGIRTGADLRRQTPETLTRHFGKVGLYYHSAAHGIDERPVVTTRVHKSLGSETTFARDLHDFDIAIESLRDRAHDVARMLVARELSARTVTVKVRFNNFKLVTRSHTLTNPLVSLRELQSVLPMLAERAGVGTRGVRLLGVTVSKLCPSGKHVRQLDWLAAN